MNLYLTTIGKQTCQFQARYALCDLYLPWQYRFQLQDQHKRPVNIPISNGSHKTKRNSLVTILHGASLEISSASMCQDSQEECGVEQSDGCIQSRGETPHERLRPVYCKGAMSFDDKGLTRKNYLPAA
jgi:hypothetical protein